MSGFLGRSVGAKGCFLQVGAGTITPPRGAKITALGVHTTANITNFKWTPRSNSSTLTQVTITTDHGWIGVSLTATAVMAYIPLEVPADEVVIASGDVMAYFD